MSEIASKNLQSSWGKTLTEPFRLGDVFAFEGVYAVNPAPETAHATITHVTHDGDDTVIEFVPADEDSAALLRKWDAQRTGEAV